MFINRRSRVAAVMATAILAGGLAAGCPGTIHQPAAQTPVVESILAGGAWTNAAYHHSGVYQMPAGNGIELRLRAPWPSTLKIQINGNDIPLVNDTAHHSEFDGTGYYRQNSVEAVTSDDPLFFWRFFVSLPRSLWSTGDYTVTVNNISNDNTLTGTAKNAPPAQLSIVRQPPLSLRPSNVFFAGPDAKHSNSGGDSALIRHNVTLAGWLVATPDRGLTDPATEDWHYDVFLDNAFIQRNYAAVNQDLSGAIMPGRWYSELDALLHPNLRIPLLTSIQPDAGTFLIPGTDLFTVELNAWHPSRHAGFKPSGWVGDVDPATWPDVYWPFPVLHPAGLSPTDPDLQEGDYVIITGALVEDSAHLHFEGSQPTAEDRKHECWFHNFQGHGGWLEIHPLDSIRRVSSSQAPLRRMNPQVVQVCHEHPAGPTPLMVDKLLKPIPATPPNDHSVLRYTELIDSRFTDMGTVSKHTVEVNPATQTDLHVYVMLDPNSKKPTFKATYLLWWEQSNEPRPAPLNIVSPSTPKSSGPPPICDKKPYLPQCGLKLDDDQDKPER